MRTQFFPGVRAISRLAPVIFLLFLLSAPVSAFASLVIMVYHNEAMYFGCDSALTRDDGEPDGTDLKIHQFSQACCVSITGSARYDAISQTGKFNFLLSLPEILERSCAEQLTNPASLDEKMELIATRMKQAYCSLTNRLVALTRGTGFPDPTHLQFVGYDDRKNCFFVSSCILDGTNSVHVELKKEYRGPHDPEPFTVEGEGGFLRALFQAEKPEVLNLLPPEFEDTILDLDSTNSIPDAKIVGFILELFHLHKDNAARLGYDPGHIGPPYRVFKITREKVIEMTSDARSADVKPAGAVVKTESEDDKAIDAVMEKLESSFLAGDYYYALDVMYSPILEAGGGKEKGRESIKAVLEQMKEKQIVCVSWKAKKPYQYIKTESRTYAIIPYEAVMMIGTQKLRQHSYQLGIKTADSIWQFTNGDSLNPAMFGQFFPDFPTTIELPKKDRSYE